MLKGLEKNTHLPGKEDELSRVGLPPLQKSAYTTICFTHLNGDYVPQCFANKIVNFYEKYKNEMCEQEIQSINDILNKVVLEVSDSVGDAEEANDLIKLSSKVLEISKLLTDDKKKLYENIIANCKDFMSECSRASSTSVDPRFELSPKRLKPKLTKEQIRTLQVEETLRNFFKESLITNDEQKNRLFKNLDKYTLENYDDISDKGWDYILVTLPNLVVPRMSQR